MVEAVYKKIPSKGTRLWMMGVMELMATLFCWYIFAHILKAGVNLKYVDEALAIFAAWSAFTQWNVGIYAMSETVVKGGEAVMNK